MNVAVYCVKMVVGLPFALVFAVLCVTVGLLRVAAVAVAHPLEWLFQGHYGVMERTLERFGEIMEFW